MVCFCFNSSYSSLDVFVGCRFEKLRETAFTFAFMVKALDMVPALSSGGNWLKWNRTKHVALYRLYYSLLIWQVTWKLKYHIETEMTFWDQGQWFPLGNFFIVKPAYSLCPEPSVGFNDYQWNQKWFSNVLVVTFTFMLVGQMLGDIYGFIVELFAGFRLHYQCKGIQKTLFYTDFSSCLLKSWWWIK